MAKPKANLSASQKQDLKTLERIRFDEHVPVPPGAFLSVIQLAEVEEMAAHGMNLAQIGEALRFESAYWQQVIELNANARSAYRVGVSNLQRKLTQAGIGLALSGDGPTLRFMLERIGGHQFHPPRQLHQIESAPPPPSAVDLDKSVQSAFEEQKRLMQSAITDADYEVIESDPIAKRQ